MINPPHAFNIPIHTGNLDLEKDTISPGVYIFANAYTWVNYLQNPSFNKVVKTSPCVFADGVGTLIPCQLHSGLSPSRISGTEFTHHYLSKWPQKPMLFIGGSQAGYEIIKKKYGLTNTKQIIPPFQDFTPNQIPKDLQDLNPLNLWEVSKNNPEAVWVCLGSPKQELWAMEAQRFLPTSKFFPIGAAFAFLSQEKKRAPQGMQTLGLEWLYRLLQNPRQHFKRCLVGNSLLLIYTLHFLFQQTHSSKKSIR